VQSELRVIILKFTVGGEPIISVTPTSAPLGYRYCALPAVMCNAGSPGMIRFCCTSTGTVLVLLRPDADCRSAGTEWVPDIMIIRYRHRICEREALARFKSQCLQPQGIASSSTTNCLRLHVSPSFPLYCTPHIVPLHLPSRTAQLVAGIRLESFSPRIIEDSSRWLNEKELGRPKR
jgi:hypothetical protein